MIQVFSNSLGERETKAVERVLKSRWLGRGEECAGFEAEFAEHICSRRSLLFNNCTSATLCLLRALGIQDGDEVIIPSVQFLGVANCIIQAGAVPVFADVDPYTLDILPQEIDRLISAKTKAVFILHYGGHPAPIRDIRAAAHGIFLLEDAANAVSSRYHGVPCGTLGDGGVWSFDAMKILSMGDGGALWTSHGWAWEWAECYRYFGFTPKTTSGTDGMRKGQDRWWEFGLTAISERHISNDVLASMGRVQLAKLPFFITARQRIWETYQAELSDIGDLILPPEPETDCETSYYLYWIQTKERDRLARYLADHGVYTTFRYYPLHRVKRYDAYRRHAGVSLPNADLAADRTLCIPLHQNLTETEIGQIIDAIKAFYGETHG